MNDKPKTPANAPRKSGTPELTEAEKLNQRLASEGNVPPPPAEGDRNREKPKAT